MSKTPSNVDSLKLRYLHKIINLCKEHSIKLVFSVSPLYSVADADLYDILKNIARENDISFLDYHTSGTFIDNPECFRDISHLCDEGARLFTPMFASDLKKIINE